VSSVNEVSEPSIQCFCSLQPWSYPQNVEPWGLLQTHLSGCEISISALGQSASFLGLDEHGKYPHTSDWLVSRDLLKKWSGISLCSLMVSGSSSVKVTACSKFRHSSSHDNLIGLGPKKLIPVLICFWISSLRIGETSEIHCSWVLGLAFPGIDWSACLSLVTGFSWRLTLEGPAGDYVKLRCLDSFLMMAVTSS
jgi:hypothetical protein